MSIARISFIEWMKAAGMLAIIYGHTNGHAILNPTLPANFKQIGVVLFIIATGYLLANERRPPLLVSFNRLFELFFFGLLLSVVVSVLSYAQSGDLLESNYLPFALGLNVLVNAFPANPSLWYVGTYIHLLILWMVLLRNLRIRPWMFLVVVPFEVMVRSVLMSTAGDFVAYQALTNWLSVLLFGMFLGQQGNGDRLDAPRLSVAAYAAGLAVIAAVWFWLVGRVGVTESNPFGRIQVGGQLGQTVLNAASISFVYLLWGFFSFQVFRRLQAGKLVNFFGRNSMLCFILHMPLIFWLTDYLFAMPVYASSPLMRLMINLLLFYVGTCVLSEAIRRLLNPGHLKAALRLRLFGALKPGS